MAFTEIDKVRVKLVDFYHRLVAYLPTLFTYSLCFALTIICIDRAEKIRFRSAANNELHQNAISQEVFDGVETVINGASVFDSIWTIVVVILCFWGSQILLRRAAGVNWSRAVTLPIAIEFSSAMRKMGKLDFAEQMACIYEHRIPVYIANDPILEDQGESVLVKLYPYIRNNLLVLEDVLTKNIGKRQLCLSAADYEPIYQQYCQTAQSVALAKVAALEQENAALKGAFSLKEDESQQLKAENTKFRDEIAGFRKNKKNEAEREQNLDPLGQTRAPFWRVGGPLMNRLISEAGPETEYTRPQIQAAFLQELEKYPELKPTIKGLLHTPKKAADNTPFDLEGWAMRHIRSGLNGYTQTGGGRAKIKL